MLSSAKASYHPHCITTKIRSGGAKIWVTEPPSPPFPLGEGPGVRGANQNKNFAINNKMIIPPTIYQLTSSVIANCTGSSVKC